MTATVPPAQGFCRHCGAGLAPGSPVCAQCGTAVPEPARPAFCRRCGTAIMAGTRFCGGCGAALPGEAIVATGSGGPAAGDVALSAPGGSSSAASGPAGHRSGGGPSAGAAVAAGTVPSPGEQAVAEAMAALSGAVAAGRTQLGEVMGRLGRRGRVPALLKVGIAVVVLVLLGSLLSSLVKGSSPRCVFSCAPNVGPVQPAGNTFTSPIGFSFGYPDGWTRTSAPGGYVAAFQNDHTGGAFVVAAGTGTPSLAGVLQQQVNFVAGGTIQELRVVGSVPGARLGSAPGAGAFYSGYAQTNGSGQQPVRVVVIAAEQNNRWAALVGLTALDQTATPTGFSDGPSFDDVITRWTWNS